MIQPTHGPTNGDGGPVAQRILKISHVFANAVRDILESRYLRETAPAPLSLSQIHLLKLIDMNGDHFVGEVADFLGVSAPAASKNVDKLARLDLLRRVTPEKDRRNTCLKITAKGRDLVRRYEERRATGLRPVLETFSEEEREEFARLLTKFVTTLIDIEEQGGRGCLRCGAFYEDGCPVHGVTGRCPYEQARRTTKP
ncbi:MAG: MarR family winged helix-turn-helix transcriptional regulator [Candidatus Eisenbacteria bacterium]